MNAHTHIRLRKVFTGCAALLIFWCTIDRAVAVIDPDTVRQELGRIEDLRRFHAGIVQELDDAQALRVYLESWGGSRDFGARIDALMQRSIELYDALMCLDEGGQCMQAEVDILGIFNIDEDRLEPLERARRLLADHLTTFYNETRAIKSALRLSLKWAASKSKTASILSQAEPWTRARSGAEGLPEQRIGMYLGPSFFAMAERDANVLLKRAVSLGVRSVTLQWSPMFDWATIEKVRGKFDFSRLDLVLNRIAAHPLEIRIRFPFLDISPPLWLVSSEGVEVMLTMPASNEEKPERKGVNLMHPGAAAACARFLSTYARHLRTLDTRVEAIEIDLAPADVIALTSPSPTMTEFWRKWSRSTTPWQSPETLMASPKREELRIVRAIKCREAWLAAYTLAITNDLEAGWPELTVIPPASGPADLLLPPLSPLIDAAAPDPVGVGPLAPCRTAMLTLTRAATLRQPAMPRSHSMAVGTGGAATEMADLLALRVNRISLEHGLDDLFQLRPSSTTSRYPDHRLTEAGLAVMLTSSMYNRAVAPVFTNTVPVPPMIGILWSPDTWRRDYSRHFRQSTLGWGQLLDNTHLPYAYVSETSLPGDLERLRVLILPNTQSLSDKAVAHIREWVTGGGTLLGFGLPGVYDENGLYRQRSPLSDVFGAEIKALRAPAPVHGAVQGNGSATITLNMAPLSGDASARICAELKRGTGTPVGWYGGSRQRVAIVKNRYRRGNSVLCGVPIGLAYWQAMAGGRGRQDDEAAVHLETWVTGQLGGMGIKPILEILQALSLEPAGDKNRPNSPVASTGFVWKKESPVRQIHASMYWRPGIDTFYVALIDSRPVDRSPPAFIHQSRGRKVTFALRPTAELKARRNGRISLVDVRLEAPVSINAADGGLTFTAWMRPAQVHVFALNTRDEVRVFGRGRIVGEPLARLAGRCATYRRGIAMQNVEVIGPTDIGKFLEARRGKVVRIAYGTTQFRRAAERLESVLVGRYTMKCRLIGAGVAPEPNTDQHGDGSKKKKKPEKIKMDILIGNSKDNPHLWAYERRDAPRTWLPLRITHAFPGLGSSLIMLSSPIITGGGENAQGKISEDRQLIIGAGFPSDAETAVGEIQKKAELFR